MKHYTLLAKYPGVKVWYSGYAYDYEGDIEFIIHNRLFKVKKINIQSAYKVVNGPLYVGHTEYIVVGSDNKFDNFDMLIEALKSKEFESYGVLLTTI